MIRVYLDWNVYSRIKTSNNDFYPELRKILLSDDKYCFPYSTPHLIDIYQSYLKVGWTNIQDHIESLRLSNNLNIKQIFGQEIAYYMNDPMTELKSFILQRNPTEKFEESKKVAKDEYIDYFPETTKFLKEQDEISEKQNELIKSFQNILHSFLGNNFKEEYQKGMNINKGKLLNDNTDKIDYLNKISSNNGFADFKDYTKEVLLKINKNPNFFDELSSLFTSIDISGYGQDTTGFSSTITDSFHCAYASTCDIFIVDDKKTYLKSKEVYGIKNLLIKTFRPKEFIDYYNKNILEFDNASKILDFAYNLPKLVEHNHKTEAENIYYLEFYLFDYFNLILINNEELENPKSINLFKYSKNNKLALLTVEKEDLIKKLNSYFGEPMLIKDSWKDDGFLNSAWLYNETELIKLSINQTEVSLSFVKCKKVK